MQSSDEAYTEALPDPGGIPVTQPKISPFVPEHTEDLYRPDDEAALPVPPGYTPPDSLILNPWPPGRDMYAIDGNVGQPFFSND
mgnify:CR=1 FL=1